MEPEELKNLPWELMHNGEDFISAGNSTLFSRVPWGVELKTWEKVIGPLRLLIVISNPLDLEPNHQLDIDSEMEALSYAFEPLEKENLLEVDCCHTASAEAVRDFLLDKDYHILHFTGHGCFAPDGQGKGRGFLLMEDSQGRKKLVDNEETARLLKEVSSLRLVTLSACQSARTSQTEAFRDVARSLLKKGIPAVAAMRLSVLDSSATIFARAFYRAIAHKKMLEEAFPMEAMQWMAEEKDIAGEAEEIMGWGLMSREKTEEGTRYSLYALVREIRRPGKEIQEPLGPSAGTGLFLPGRRV